MIVLNYHRIQDEPDTDFYTVSPAVLRSHLEKIQLHGLRVIDTDEALAAKNDGGFVMLHFDDGTSDHFEHAASLLGQFGMWVFSSYQPQRSARIAISLWNKSKP